MLRTPAFLILAALLPSSAAGGPKSPDEPQVIRASPIDQEPFYRALGVRPSNERVKRAIDGPVHGSPGGVTLREGAGSKLAPTTFRLLRKGKKIQRMRVELFSDGAHVAVYLDPKSLAKLARADLTLASSAERARPKPSRGRGVGVHVFAGTRLREKKGAARGRALELELPGGDVAASGFAARRLVGTSYSESRIERKWSGSTNATVPGRAVIFDAPEGDEMARLRSRQARVWIRVLGRERRGFLKIRYRGSAAGVIGWVPEEHVVKKERSSMPDGMIGGVPGGRQGPGPGDFVELQKGARLYDRPGKNLVGLTYDERTYAVVKRDQDGWVAVTVPTMIGDLTLYARP